MSENKDLESAILSDALSFMEKTVKKVFESREEIFVHSLVTSFQEVVGTAPRDHTVKPELSTGDWIGIESLSRLRSVVGGRFQNIKKRWTDAGFPLKEHRGDREISFEFNKEGWMELTSWIAKQGFEARLTDKNSGYLFELRKLS